MIVKADAQSSRPEQRTNTRISRNNHKQHASSPPVRPSRPAPARFGVAGLSADHGARIKDRITLRRGPLMGRRREQSGVVSDHDSVSSTLSTALGWLSIGLGLTEVVGAEPLADWLGMRDQAKFLRLYGFRELGSGIGILSSRRQQKRAIWMWSRVLGDAMDIATLAKGLSRENPNRAHVEQVLTAVLGVTALDMICALRQHRVHSNPQSLSISTRRRHRADYDPTMDKPKQRGTNKPKSFSPNREEKRVVENIRAKRTSDDSKHTAGGKTARLKSTQRSS